MGHLSALAAVGAHRKCGWPGLFSVPKAALPRTALKSGGAPGDFVLGQGDCSRTPGVSPDLFFGGGEYR